jgi:hypothetical protein
MAGTGFEVARASSPCFLGCIHDPSHGLEARATSVCFLDVLLEMPHHNLKLL